MFNISGLVRFRRRASCVIRPSVDFHNHALIGEAEIGFHHAASDPQSVVEDRLCVWVGAVELCGWGWGGKQWRVSVR